MNKKMQSKWDEFYKNTPPDKIPWGKVQADFFVELLSSGKLGEGGDAIDLGCGVGRKSIQLAKRGFNVVGVDIAEEAIRQAKQNAKNEDVDIEFVVHDATDLSFLNDRKFDLVLDWANLHGIEESKRIQYISEIAKHTKKGGLLVLRCFSKEGLSKNSLGAICVMGAIHFFSEDDIKGLYGEYFEIEKVGQSKYLTDNKQLPDRLDEYLMRRK